MQNRPVIVTRVELIHFLLSCSCAEWPTVAAPAQGCRMLTSTQLSANTQVTSSFPLTGSPTVHAGYCAYQCYQQSLSVAILTRGSSNMVRSDQSKDRETTCNDHRGACLRERVQKLNSDSVRMLQNCRPETVPHHK